MRLRLSEAIDSAMDEEALARMTEGRAPDADALVRIRERTLRKAERDGKGRRRRALRIAVAAVALVGVLGTSLAVSDWGREVLDRFRGRTSFPAQIDVLGRYGTAIDESDEDQGVRASVVAAYANEIGNMLMFRFEDAKGRLDADTEFEFKWKGFGGSYSKEYEVGDDGALYAFVNMNPETALAGKRIDLRIESFHRERSMKEVVGRIEGSRVVLDEGASNLLPGLQVYADADAIASRATYSEGDVRYALDGVTLRGPGGEDAYTDQGMSYNNDDARFVHYESHFAGLSKGDFDGYQIVLNYRVEDRFICGNWNLSFRIPEDEPARRVAIDRTFVAADGREIRVESALIARNGVKLETSTPQSEKDTRAIAPEAYGDRWYETERPDPLPRLVLKDAEGKEIPGGYGGAWFPNIIQRGERYYGAATFNIDTTIERIDLCVYYADEPDTTWVIPIK